MVLEREGVDESRVTVVNNGIDLPHRVPGVREAIRSELGFDAGNLVVGMVANYNRPVKGVGRFLDAIPEIVSAVPGSRFLFVGGGGEERELREKARTLGVEPYVVLAGYRKDIQRYYEAMDLSVLTSFSEGLSLTLLESMGYGIPIVATRVGGNPEVVEEGVNGYLVGLQDRCALVERIVKLLKDCDLRRRMVRRGVCARRRNSGSGARRSGTSRSTGGLSTELLERHGTDAIQALIEKIISRQGKGGCNHKARESGNCRREIKTTERKEGQT